MATKHLSYLSFDHIILWRHAEAEQADFELGELDNMRQLSIKGQRQAKRMAQWLKEHLPKNTFLLSSPAIRAVQTAQALRCKIQIDSALKPGASLLEVLNALTQHQQQKNNLIKNILIVGHQPWLGELVAYLFEQGTIDIADIQTLNIKKGAVWWLRLHPTKNSAKQLAYNLHALQTPSLL